MPRPDDDLVQLFSGMDPGMSSSFSSNLLTSDNNQVAREFRKNIRTYNNIFAFCSVGAVFDPSVWGPSGHRIVRLHGQLYHRIGSLLPDSSSEQKPQFSQTYIMDGDEDHIAETRAAYSHGKADKQTILRIQVSFASFFFPYTYHALQNILRRCNNPYVLAYRHAKDRVSEDDTRQFGFKMLNPANRDPRRYNRPTVGEIAVVMPGDGSELQRGRDIIVETYDGRLKRVSELHSSFLPLRFPFLRPHGEQGWNDNIPLKNNTTAGNAYRQNASEPTPQQRGRGGSTRVTQAQWYTYYLHSRPTDFNLLLRAATLLQEFVVDAWAQTEANRLRFLEMNQTRLRVDLYNGLMDAAEGDLQLEEVGKRTILPSSYTGSPRQMIQLYQDALGIVRHAGVSHFHPAFIH